MTQLPQRRLRGLHFMWEERHRDIAELRFAIGLFETVRSVPQSMKHLEVGNHRLGADCTRRTRAPRSRKCWSANCRSHMAGRTLRLNGHALHRYPVGLAW